MTDSAERPLIGPDPAGEANVPDGLNIEPEGDTLPDEAENLKASRPYAPRWRDRDDADDPDDGPVIRRMSGSAAPRMFGQQLDLDENLQDDALPPSRPQRTSAHPAGFYGHPEDRHPPSSSRNEAFSVAAIREKRMRRPAGTHTPTRMGTKLTVAALASVCMLSAGVALGLYGQDIGRSIEQQARSASTHVSTAVGRLMAAAASSLDQGSAGSTQASLAGAPPAPKPADAALTAAADASPAPAAGSKLIYERLPTAQDDTASRSGIPPAREARAMTAGSVTGLEQLLAPPADFSTPPLQID